MTMEITNLLDVHSREELYRWYQDNHDKAADFWLRINRAKADCEGWCAMSMLSRWRYASGG